MNPDLVINYGKEASQMILMLSMPMLIVALVVGVAISLCSSRDSNPRNDFNLCT
jgi:flagellar biosynthesis protein FliQ